MLFNQLKLSYISISAIAFPTSRPEVWETCAAAQSRSGRARTFDCKVKTHKCLSVILREAFLPSLIRGNIRLRALPRALVEKIASENRALNYLTKTWSQSNQFFLYSILQFLTHRSLNAVPFCSLSTISSAFHSSHF